MKPSEVLEAAKEYLADRWVDSLSQELGDKTTFICIALSVWARKEGNYEDANRATDIVEKAIGGHSTLTSYLRDLDPNLYFGLCADSPDYPMIRDNWLDDLIAKLQKEGQ
jgi:hypothetical protein